MNYCMDCKYFRKRFMYKLDKEITPYIPGQKRESWTDFVCPLLSDDIRSYSGEEVNIEEIEKAQDIVGIVCPEPVSHSFAIIQPDKFGCNLFKKKENKNE